MDTIAQLIANGEIRECAACGQLSAYGWEHVAEKKHYFRGCYEKGEIAHIGAASCFEWECGHCGANNAFRDAPILAECYTHQPVPQYKNVPRHARYHRKARAAIAPG